MKQYSTSHWLRAAAVLVLLALGTYFTQGLPAYAHGGKDHGGIEFTALQALQKSTQLYDKLITSGKLPETWETGLEAVQITTRKTGDVQEYVIQYRRADGDPKQVYFFFNQKGEYTGSNFTGN